MKVLLFLSVLLLCCSLAEFIPFPCRETDGWMYFNSYCYKVFDVLGKFADAERKCRTEWAHLASIHSKEENDFLQGKTKRGEIQKDHWQNHIWIGLIYSKYTNRWYWTDGSEVNYKNWAKDEPNHKNGEFLGAIMPDTSYENYPSYNPDGGQWNDHNNRDHRGFICKKHVYLRPPLNNNGFDILSLIEE